MGLVPRAGNEDSLHVIFNESLKNNTQVLVFKHSVHKHATKKELPVAELSGAPALVVQASAYCFPAVAHMTSTNRKNFIIGSDQMNNQVVTIQWKR